jgi:competence protein ComEC
MAGIVFGSKEDFSDDFFEKLKLTGVLHVIAASGMNVAFFTGAVMFSLGAFLKRQLALILSVFAVVFYSFLVGFEPSILRASIMAIIAFTASFFGRQTLAVLALFATGFVMLLWRPSYLFDVGFQLSFVATLGILIIGQVLGKLERLGALAEDFKTTLSAQLATFPILLGAFGSIGVLSLVVNVVVLWTVPILMLLGVVAVVVGLVFPLLGKALLLLSFPFLFFFEVVIKAFGSIGWVITVESWPWQLSVGYYLLLGALTIGLKKRVSK